MAMQMKSEKTQETVSSNSGKFWDKAADKYSKSKISDEASYQRKLTETQHCLSPDMHVVEFGCGTGTTAIHHAPFVKSINAIDISENMLAIAREKALEANVTNITFTKGTLSDLKAPSESIDAVLGLNVLHLMPDWQTSLGEVARILRPGGVFVSSTACIGQSPLRLIKLFAPLGIRLGLMPDVYVLKEAELVAAVTDAGFNIETQWHHGGIARTVFLIARKQTN
jgi:ubiquinone/menaquinone biosynthesis C-methylase UbiE